MGIRATLGRLSQMLRCQDEQLWEHLEKGLRINPQFYAFRWVPSPGETRKRGKGSTGTAARLGRSMKSGCRAQGL